MTTSPAAITNPVPTSHLSILNAPSNETLLYSNNNKNEPIMDYMKEISISLNKIDILLCELKKNPDNINTLKNILRQFQIIQAVSGILSEFVKPARA